MYKIFLGEFPYSNDEKHLDCLGTIIKLNASCFTQGIGQYKEEVHDSFIIVCKKGPQLYGNIQ